MSKFDYMNFYGGYDTSFVVNAKKFSKEQAIELCLIENDGRFDPKYAGLKLCRMPMIEDIEEWSIRYYVKAPESTDYDGEGGIYSFCKPGKRGSFPVWVISLDTLRRNKEVNYEPGTKRTYKTNH
jgi:hypothetical protein